MAHNGPFRTEVTPPVSGGDGRADTIFRAGMETILLLMIAASPWAYGAVHPGFEFLLHLGLAIMLALWAARMVVNREFTWKKCPFAVCLAGLFLLGVWQTTPLPRPVLEA